MCTLPDLHLVLILGGGLLQLRQPGIKDINDFPITN